MCFFPIRSEATVTNYGEFHTGKVCAWGKFPEPSINLLLFMDDCSTPKPSASPLCELRRSSRGSHSRPEIRTTSGASSIPLVQCPMEHRTHPFLACDIQTQCWSTTSQRYGVDRHSWALPLPSACAWNTSTLLLPPSLACDLGDQHVPYSLVCDHRQDCQDNSDEDFCHFPPCPSLTGWQCASKQCVSKHQRCDGTLHCFDRTDEETCEHQNVPSDDSPYTHWRHVVQFESLKQDMLVSHKRVNSGTHFVCPGTHIIMAVYFLCNGVFDCPGHEDEEDCSEYTCPGYYRCRGSKVCVHTRSLCDGIPQCPQFDDELLCDLNCPHAGCTCYGQAFTCTATFDVRLYPHLRYLNAAGSGMTPDLLTNNTLLIHLSLAGCGLKSMGSLGLPNLRSLDVSSNQIESTSLSDLSRLRLSALFLADNPLSSTMFSSKSNGSVTFPSLQRLDMSLLPINGFDSQALSPFTNLHHLNISYTNIDHITHDFGLFTHLKSVDVRGCSMSRFPKSLLKSLASLERVWGNTYRMCCELVLPAGFNQNDCHAPRDKLSTCHSLLGSDANFSAMTVYAVLTLLGNMISFVFRVFIKKSGRQAGYGIVVTHLSVSDFISGLHLVVVLTADRLYHGHYVWEDTAWRHSAGCQLAGVLSTLSRHGSTFLVVLLTLDRVWALGCPRPNTPLSSPVVHLMCAMAWALALLLAVVPWVSPSSVSASYSVLGMCTLLPDTKTSLSSFSAYITAVEGVMHLTLFLVVGCGQSYVYLKIKTNPYSFMDSGSTKSADLDVGKRLLLLCVTNLLCRLVLSLGRLMSAWNVRVSEDVLVGMLLFLGPLPSVVTPCLYARGIAVQRRTLLCRQRLLQRLRVMKK